MLLPSAEAGGAPHDDFGLSGRETEVAAAVAGGLSNKQVADRPGISVRTVENHLRSIFAKCNVFGARRRDPLFIRY